MPDLETGQRWIAPDGRWLEIGPIWRATWQVDVHHRWGWSTIGRDRLMARLAKQAMRMESGAEREARLAAHAACVARNRQAGIQLRQAKQRAAALADLLSGPQQGHLFDDPIRPVS